MHFLFGLVEHSVVTHTPYMPVTWFFQKFYEFVHALLECMHGTILQNTLAPLVSYLGTLCIFLSVVKIIILIGLIILEPFVKHTGTV
jgi:hypothetical protein